jgi:hypothetical protein
MSKEVELSDGHSATIIARYDLTVRTARAIERAKSKTLGASVSLADAGYRPEHQWPKLPSIIEEPWFESYLTAKADGFDYKSPDDRFIFVGRQATMIARYEEVYAIREAFANANLRALSNLSDAERDALDNYENDLVINMVVDWTYEFPCTTENIETMNGEVFGELASACQAEYDGSAVEVEADPDPLATTDGSLS